MRKITQEAVREFRNGCPFRKQNTSVVITEYMVVLKLHGNAIARYPIGEFDALEVCDGGWSSNTTKERLNGICGVSVHQKNWQWYLNSHSWSGNWVFVRDYP